MIFSIKRLQQIDGSVNTRTKILAPCLCLRFSLALDSCCPGFFSKSRRNHKKEIANNFDLKCNLASRTAKYRQRVDPTGMKSEPGRSCSICWTQVMRRHFYEISIVPADSRGRVFGASVRRGFKETQMTRGFRVIQFNRAFFIHPVSMNSIQSNQLNHFAM
jgi:hypothetical protein